MIPIAHRTGLDLSRDPNEAIEVWLRSIYDRYSSSLFRYALALTGSVDDAQDAVQEVFARVTSEWRHMMEVRNMKAYLFRATRNSAYSVLRKRRRGKALHDAICADLAAICVPHARQVSATIISIREAFNLLSTEQREVLVLKILNQLTFKEIAEATGIPMNTVSARYRYGIIKLRHALGTEILG